ncbi:hypothetical protein SCUP515_09516 [Seiridium cupressi]
MGSKSDNFPQFTKAKDFTQTSRSVSPARSTMPVTDAYDGAETITTGTNGTGVASLLPDPVTGSLRRYPTKATTDEPLKDVTQKLSRTFPVSPMTSRRAFFISPFLRTPKTSRDVSPERNPEEIIFQIQMTQAEKRDTNATQKSDATDEEWEHQLRMERRRRVREFPRRLATSIIGGIFVIAPMVIMSIDRSLTKDLIASSVAVLLFGMTLAWLSTSDEISLFVATVGYAAFLAVFVAVGDDNEVHVGTER